MDATLQAILERAAQPQPWAEGDNIPWNEPGFSKRMLVEHLSQVHDAASRRVAIIDRHVAWIHGSLLGGRPSTILDLGCGPGLYTERFAERGHRCLGIDFSPASIEHAVKQAEESSLQCRYVLGDIRETDYGTDHSLAMLVFGELNVFRPAHARTILERIHAALADGGRVLLEVSTEEAIREFGTQPREWSAKERGIFSAGPHLRFNESFWDADTKTATRRYFILHHDGRLDRFAQTMQAYSRDELAALLASCGFRDPRFLAAMGVEGEKAMQVLVAHR